MPLAPSSSACRKSSVNLLLPPSMMRSSASSRFPSSLTVASVAAPAGTITHTVRGAGRACTSSWRLPTSLMSGFLSYPVTSTPPLRRRWRMLPPILPRPTSPMCTVISCPVRPGTPALLWRSVGVDPTPATGLIVRQVAAAPVAPACRGPVVESAGEADRHQQVAVAVVVVALGLGLAGEDGGLLRHRERQPGERRAERPEPVQEEGRVERDREVLAVQRTLDRLGRLRVLTLARLEGHSAVG